MQKQHWCLLDDAMKSYRATQLHVFTGSDTESYLQLARGAAFAGTFDSPVSVHTRWESAKMNFEIDITDYARRAGWIDTPLTDLSAVHPTWMLRPQSARQSFERILDRSTHEANFELH